MQSAADTANACRRTCQQSVHDGALGSREEQARLLRNFEQDNQALRRLLREVCGGESRSGPEDDWSKKPVEELRLIVQSKAQAVPERPESECGARLSRVSSTGMSSTVSVTTPSRAGSRKGEGSCVAGGAGTSVYATMWDRLHATQEKENVSATSKASLGATSTVQEDRALRPMNVRAEIAGDRSNRETSSVTATRTFLDVAMMDANGNAVPVIGRLRRSVDDHKGPDKGTGQQNIGTNTGARTPPFINENKDGAAESSFESPDVEYQFALRRQARRAARSRTTR